MDGVENLLRRIGVMMERGQVFSEPALPSRTDRRLDALLARSKRPPHGRARSEVPSPSDRAGHSANWLDLPSLQELIDARRALLEQRGGAWVTRVRRSQR